jgi:hypothetical protein
MHFGYTLTALLFAPWIYLKKICTYSVVLNKVQLSENSGNKAYTLFLHIDLLSLSGNKQPQRTVIIVQFSISQCIAAQC